MKEVDGLRDLMVSGGMAASRVLIGVGCVGYNAEKRDKKQLYQCCRR